MFVGQWVPGRERKCTGLGAGVRLNILKGRDPVQEPTWTVAMGCWGQDVQDPRALSSVSERQRSPAGAQIVLGWWEAWGCHCPRGARTGGPVALAILGQL